MARGILLLFLATLIAGCASSTHVSMSPSEKWIQRQGGECVGDDACRVNRLADRLAAMIDRPIRVTVVGRDELLAFGWPGGRVFVTRGLVRACSDDELTAVIGHEMGHLLQDGHLHTTVSLTGQPNPDREAGADAISVRLLTTAGLPSSSMRTALMKVAADQPERSPVREALRSRIALLP